MDTPDKCPKSMKPDRKHYWNSQLRQQSMKTESDWCINCGATRPGYLDPRKKWDK